MGAAVVVVAAGVGAPTPPAVMLACAHGVIIAKLTRAAPSATAIDRANFRMTASFVEVGKFYAR
jgi:hypothetical protein